MGAPLRAVLKQLVARTVPSDPGKPIALVHRPNESFFLIPEVSNFIHFITAQNGENYSLCI